MFSVVEPLIENINGWPCEPQRTCEPVPRHTALATSSASPFQLPVPRFLSRWTSEATCSTPCRCQNQTPRRCPSLARQSHLGLRIPLPPHPRPPPSRHPARRPTLRLVRSFVAQKTQRRQQSCPKFCQHRCRAFQTASLLGRARRQPMQSMIATCRLATQRQQHPQAPTTLPALRLTALLRQTAGAARRKQQCSCHMALRRQC